MNGFFELRTTGDLRKKLNIELEQLKAEPTNAYVAFNLFVTAEHLLDWLYPGKANREKRSAARNASLIMQICSHIANGAKHFEVEDPRHTSVAETSHIGGYNPPGYFPGGYMPQNYFPEPRLVVQLDGAASQQYGQMVSAQALAQHIADYWNSHPEIT